MRHRNLFYLFVVICILVLFAGCSDFFGGNFTTDIQFKINLNDLQLDSRSASPANEVAKLSVELISQDNSVSLKQEQNIIDNTTDYFTFKNIKVGTIIKINATISQEDKELYVGETEWLDVKPNSNLISLVLEKIYYPESKVTLTFDADDYYEKITGIVGNSLTPPKTPTKTGYTFAGWEPELPEVYPEEDTTFTALWTPNTYTVTFNANGETGEMTSQTFTYDEEQKLFANTFTLDGHYFHRWNTESDGSGTSYEDKALVKNLTAENNGTVKLYAQWLEIGTYTISYKLDGGENNSANPPTYKETDADITLYNPTKSGYTFEGWKNEDGNIVTSIPAGTTGNITLYAQWKAINGTITVTFPSYSDQTYPFYEPITEDYKIKFTAASGYLYTLYVDDVEQVIENTIEIDTTNMAGGIYTVMLIATNVDTGEMYSAEYQIEIRK